MNTKANIGANNGKKLETNQRVNILKINRDLGIKKLDYLNTKIENIIGCEIDDEYYQKAKERLDE